jgi:UPF0042 nucleotide-binding protein
MNLDVFRLVVITGLSGAGKSQALQNFEDSGYFCIDNLPPGLLVKFVELCRQSRDKHRAAVVCDLRGGEFFADLYETVSQLRRLGLDFELVFLEASDEAMINRYKETRRRHPLSPEGSVLDGIRIEREKLVELRGMADLIIDTSGFSPAALRQELLRRFGQPHDPSMTVSVTSFGFKYGVPPDADNVIDVRFLPNPYYVDDLKILTGRDEPVRDFVLGSPTTTDFLERYLDLLHFTLPLYKSEGRQHLALAVGCTGGQHRSVALAEEIYRHLLASGYRGVLKHRDIPNADRRSNIVR